jgi:hypothetical protein
MKPLVYLPIAATSISSTTTTADFDLGPYINVGHHQVYGVWAPGIYGADTDELYACHFEESASTVSSDFGDVTDGAFTSQYQDESIAVQVIKFVPTKRYIRAVTTLSGTTPTSINYVGLLVGARFDT